MTCTPQVLAAAASCFQCLSEAQLAQINAYLLCQIVNNGGGGSGGNQPVIYTSDPNTEALTPANVNLPGMAYSADGSGAVFGWSVTQQKWL